MNLEEKLKKEGICPVALLEQEKDGKSVFRIQGSQEALKKYFNEVYDWKLYPHNASVEDNEEISFYGEEEGFVLLDKDDPVIPKLKRMALDLFIEKLKEKSKKRAEMLKGLKNHFDIEIIEDVSEPSMIAIDPYVEGFCFAVDPDLFDNPTLMTGKEDIEIDENTPIEEVITIIKKAIIEK
jgi:hypothetical protein